MAVRSAGRRSGFVRVCFATDEALLREAIVRIRRFVDTLVR